MQGTELNDALAAATDVAHRAGDVLREAYGRPREVVYKGEIDLVTQADRDAEALIVAALREQFPAHTILAEEGGGTDGDGGPAPTWLVDPLDGTTNFAHGFPAFAVSIALRDADGELLLGVVHDPLRGETFSATHKGGATLDGERINVTEQAEIGRALLATGFPYDSHSATDNNTAAFARFLRRAQGIRRAGAAALDLAYVACGRLDGFWERGLHPWDVAAGILLVREAGGTATNYMGGEDGLHEGAFVVTSNGFLHAAMLAVLAESGDKS